jgi:hypothetical protein
MGWGRRPRASAVAALLLCCALLVSPVAAKEKKKKKEKEHDDDDAPSLRLLSRTLPREVPPGVSIVVHARVDHGRKKLSQRDQKKSVTLISRFGFNKEVRVAMRDDGVSPDQYADDGVFVATIKTGDKGWPGGMVRWRAEATVAPQPPPGSVTAESKTAKTKLLKAPPFESAKSPRYYGTVLGGRNHSTELDVMHVFAPAADAAGMTTDEGAAVSLSFRGRFYDNVKVRR